MSTATVNTAALAQAREAAQEAASKAAQRAAEAQAKLDQAQAAIDAQKQARVRAWAEDMVRRQRELEKDAERCIIDARAAFQAAIAAGDLGEALGHYYRWTEAVGAALGLQAQLSRARYELSEDPNRVAEVSQRIRPGSFAEVLSNAVSHAASNRSRDVQDAAQAELDAALRGEAVPDGR